jgi:hypothetical protein
LRFRRPAGCHDHPALLLLGYRPIFDHGKAEDSYIEGERFLVLPDDESHKTDRLPHGGVPI